MSDATLSREYQRVSYDRSGRERSSDEQHDDNQAAADRLGWTLHPTPYRDKGSASRYARRARGDFARLIADLEAGHFGAQILMLWESSRGSRKVSEWCQLIELCESAKVQIYITSDGKLYDCENPRDRRSLQEDAVDSEYEAAKTSKRVNRASAANAKDGRPNGPAPYGYVSTYDATTGRLAGREIEPAEAAVVKEIFRRIDAGHSLRSIATDLESRGIRTRGRRPRGGGDPTPASWNHANLRAVAMNRAYIAERTHDPAGRTQKPSPGAVYYPAEWPPLVDRALFKRVHDRLTDEARTTTRPGRGVHWLSRLPDAVVCDPCGHWLSRRLRAGGTETYSCHRAQCVSVPYAELNAFAEAAVLAYLARDDVAQALTEEPVDPDAVAKVEAEIADIDSRIDALADQLSTGGPVAQKLLDRTLPKLETQLQQAKARRDELTAPARLRGLIAPGPAVKRRWRATPMETRRQIAAIVMVPDLLGQLRVVRAGKAWRTGVVGSVRVPIRERVQWVQD